jgi:hypothetical protein
VLVLRQFHPRHADRVESRPPTTDESEIIDALLGFAFEGVETLRAQFSLARVHSSCNCGCGSIGFDFADPASLPRAIASNPLPVEAEVLDSEGEVIGGVIVLLRDGLLDDVDVYSASGSPLPMPRLDQLRWWRRP